MAFNIVAGVNNAVYGSVSGSGSYEEGAEVTLEVTVNDGYRFVEWSDGNTDNPRIFNASEDLTLMATLEAIPEYAVTLSANNDNLGSTNGAGSYREGSVATISATPSSHCRFVKWDDDNTDNPRSITVNSAVTLEAIFETVNWYSISTSVNDATMGSVTGAGDYDEGETVTLTAVPNTDYRFVEWNDGNRDNPRTFTAAASGNYEATFAKITYANVTIGVNDSELGSISGATSSSLEVGSTITITATPATDCRFLYWETGGEEYSYDDTLVFEITEDVTITAVFEAITFYQVNLITSDTEYGTINIVSASETARGVANNIYPEDTIITVDAVPATGGKFLNWGDGDIRTRKTFNVNSNLTLRANFYPESGLILVAAHKIQKVWTTIKSFFSAPTGASKIGVPANNALGATTLADVVNSVGQVNGLAKLNASGKVAAADIDGTLANDTTGNAATATTASQLGTTTVGASDTPIYLNAGTATACGTSLAVDITGNAATATSATTATSCTGNAATASVASKVAYTQTTYNGNRPLAISYVEGITNTANFNNAVLFSNKVYFHPTNGTLTSTGTSGTSSVDGKAAFESALTSSTYKSAYNGGVIINSTAAKGFNMLTRMKSTNGKFMHGVYNADYQFYYVADTVTTNTVTKTCLTINENGTVSAPNGFVGNVTGNCSGSSGSCTGNAATATTAASCTGNAATATTASACSGNAATATTATNTNNAKLTHTVGNSEYPLVFGSSFVITDAQQALRIGTPSATANQCPLRVKAYCAAANTQGEAYLVLGNALATATANNSRGGLVMYGTGTAYNFIKMNTVSTNGKTIFLNTANTADITLTLPSATGTIALTSSNITGSSASCTGNAATATSATSATTATNANNLKVTHTGAAWRDVLGVATGFTSASNQAVYGHNSGAISFYVDANATSGDQRGILRLGNATANTTAAGHNGALWLYGTGTTYIDFRSNAAANKQVTIKTTGSTAREYTLPDKAGTFAMTSDIPTVITPGDYITETWWAPNYSTTTSNSNTDNSKSTFWYIKFNSGLLIQGCRGFGTSTGSSSLTWKIAFTKAPYLYAGVNTRKTTSGGDSWDYIYSMSTTGMTVLHEAGNGFYVIAIGQWK